jgi:hypothetical protein
MRLCWDIEANGLLDDTTVDYTASPYKLKDSFEVHCAVFIDVDSGEEFVFVQDETKRVKEFVLDTATELIGHNTISYDHMVMMAKFGLDFDIGVSKGRRNDKFYNTFCDTICGKPITITDTLVLSKTLNPDRTGHSIEYFGKMHGEAKIDWRAKAIELGLIGPHDPPGAEFKVYHHEMLVYNKQDVVSNIKTWKFLLKEWGDWDWREAYELEKRVRLIITRQEHRGFKFNEKLAVECVRDLDEKMAKLKEIVEPLIPPKPLTKTAAKEYIPPKIQFKKDGSLSANIQKWVEKHRGALKQHEGGDWTASFNEEGYENKRFTLPIPQEPIITHMPATIKDTTHIKQWLVGLGWKPTAYKERDLTVDFKKHKLTPEKYFETCMRYIEQTLESPFKEDRFEHLEVDTEQEFRNKLLKHSHTKRPLKVLTNPSLTVGVEKEIDPALAALVDKFAHAKDISDFLTYSHRRNSILGGGVDPDDEDEEAEKGWLSNGRIAQDGRIPTPADTCGAGTTRFKHRIVANVPRVTSLYGELMRELFGSDVEEGFYQLGYDFASLEAMVEAHYCWKYDDAEKSYSRSLTMEKPNDVHTKTAARISEVLGREFKRTPAKNVKYCVPMHTTALTRSGWKHFDELEVGELVLGYDPVTKTKKWTRVTDKVSFDSAEVFEFGNSWTKFQATAEHRWFVKQRKEFSTGKPNFSIRDSVDEVRVTSELNTESSIIMNAPWDSNEDVFPQCATGYITDVKYGADWVRRVLDMSHEQRTTFIEGFMVADGHHTGNIWNWAQNVGDIQEAALLASYLVHDGAVQVTHKEGWKGRPMKHVRLTKKPHRGLQTSKMVSLGEQPVWCITTELGSWVMRQGDVITITGNCCAYGGQPKRVAKTVGCSVEDGAKIHGAYWDAAKPLALLAEKLTNYWETTGGKKFILGIDGRKIMTRSKSALINSLFQSTGVICAKRAMVLHDQKLREAGLTVDFWKDHWKSKAFVQQLIAYHDEAQMEVHKSLIKWKLFETEEEAKAFKAEHPTWSEVGHSDKGYYVGWCKAGELIQEAVRETSEYYKLNVTLAADYILGRNWAECH